MRVWGASVPMEPAGFPLTSPWPFARNSARSTYALGTPFRRPQANSNSSFRSHLHLHFHFHRQAAWNPLDGRQIRVIGPANSAPQSGQRFEGPTNTLARLWRTNERAHWFCTSVSHLLACSLARPPARSLARSWSQCGRLIGIILHLLPLLGRRTNWAELWRINDWRPLVAMDLEASARRGATGRPLVKRAPGGVGARTVDSGE